MSKLDIKILGIFLFMFFPFTCKMCEKPFEPNPNLRLLLKDENYSLINPIWTKSGWIYYIKEFDHGASSGDIYRIYEDGTDNQLVIKGVYNRFDVSKSETLIVAIEPNDPFFEHEGKVCIINLNNLEKKFLPGIFYGRCVRFFGFSDSFVLIYHGDGNVFIKVNLHSFKHDTIYKMKGIMNFDLYNDSLLYFIERIKTKSYIYNLFTHRIESEGHFWGIKFLKYNPRKLIIKVTLCSLGIYDWLTYETQVLDTKPYKICKVGRADVNDSEDKIVFSVSKGEGRRRIRFKPYELWILEKF